MYRVIRHELGYIQSKLITNLCRMNYSLFLLFYCCPSLCLSLVPRPLGLACLGAIRGRIVSALCQGKRVQVPLTLLLLPVSSHFLLRLLVSLLPVSSLPLSLPHNLSIFLAMLDFIFTSYLVSLFCLSQTNVFLPFSSLLSSLSSHPSLHIPQYCLQYCIAGNI